MARTGPSATDQALMNELATRGVTLTASRLERWRHVGLTPRPRQDWSGGGGSRTYFDQPLTVVADHVAAVATRARRGQPAAVFADLAAAARARPATPPVDDLDEAEQVAAVILDSTANSAPWPRNLKANRDLVTPTDVDLVLTSATTAMV